MTSEYFVPAFRKTPFRPGFLKSGERARVHAFTHSDPGGSELWTMKVFALFADGVEADGSLDKAFFGYTDRLGIQAEKALGYLKLCWIPDEYIAGHLDPFGYLESRGFHLDYSSPESLLDSARRYGIPLRNFPSGLTMKRAIYLLEKAIVRSHGTQH